MSAVVTELAMFAKADIPYSVGLMILLMVVTVVYIPLVLVPLVEGIEVAAWDIAKPLIFGRLLPLGIALLVRVRYPESAKLAPHLNQISSVTLAIALVIGLVLGLPSLIGAFGTGAFIATVAFVVIRFVVGYLLIGRNQGQRWVGTLGTSQRNVSAALLIATTSFAGQTEVLVMVMVGTVMMAPVLMPLAAEIGKRSQSADVPG